MNPKCKKFISLFLVFSLMTLSVNLYAKERRGAHLIVTKKDGQLIEGELITVKENSLLLLDTEGKDMSVNIADIKVIRIERESQSALGGGLGFLAGGIFGFIRGLILGDSPPSALIHLTANEKALFLGIFYGSIGALIGFILGSAAGKDKTIQIEGMTDSKIQETLEYLHKKARIRDYK